MKLSDAVVLITGANRGIGLEFAKQALKRGARKVYAGARDPNSIPLQDVVKIKVDVTNLEGIQELAKQVPDINLLVNNAGIARFGSFLDQHSEESCHAHFDTNFFGPLRLIKALAPVLASNGGGSILNVLSVASWINSPVLAAYGASKSAAWALTNSIRQELAQQGTQVTALHMGFVDTDLTREIEQPKAKPEDIVARAYDGLEEGLLEVLADDAAIQIKGSLSSADPYYLAIGE